MFTIPGTDVHIGGVFIIVFVSWLVGLLVFIYMRIKRRRSSRSRR